MKNLHLGHEMIMGRERLKQEKQVLKDSLSFSLLGLESQGREGQ